MNNKFPYRAPSPIEQAASLSIGEGATFSDMEAMVHEDWDTSLKKTVDLALEDPLFQNRSFFVVVNRRREVDADLDQVKDRNLFDAKLACPTPQCKQTVYQYHHNSGILQFLWTIPSREQCAVLKYYALDLNEDERTLLEYVIEYESGKLLELARKLNKEHDDQPQIALVLKKEQHA